APPRGVRAATYTPALHPAGGISDRASVRPTESRAPSWALALHSAAARALNPAARARVAPAAPAPATDPPETRSTHTTLHEPHRRAIPTHPRRDIARWAQHRSHRSSTHTP